MSKKAKKVKIYAKLIGIALIFLLILAFVLQNANKVSVKFLFWQTPELPMYVFVIAAGNCGILIFLIIRKIKGVFREIRTLRSSQQESE